MFIGFADYARLFPCEALFKSQPYSFTLLLFVVVVVVNDSSLYFLCFVFYLLDARTNAPEGSKHKSAKFHDTRG
jgi:hypothetical protein